MRKKRRFSPSDPNMYCVSAYEAAKPRKVRRRADAAAAAAVAAAAAPVGKSTGSPGGFGAVPPVTGPESESAAVAAGATVSTEGAMASSAIGESYMPPSAPTTDGNNCGDVSCASAVPSSPKRRALPATASPPARRPRPTPSPPPLPPPCPGGKRRSAATQRTTARPTRRPLRRAIPTAPPRVR